MIPTAELADFYSWVAHSRERWKERNRFYHDQVLDLLRSRVAPGLRVLEVGSGLGDTLAALEPARGVGVDLSPEMVRRAAERHPDLEFHCADAHTLDLGETFDVVLLNDTVMDLDDIQVTLQSLRRHLEPDGCLLLTFYNHLWEPLLKLAEDLGQRQPHRLQNWLTPGDVANFLRLADYAVVDEGSAVLVPRRLPGAGLLNRLLAPRLRPASLVHWAEARLTPEPEEDPLRCSVVIPCRDEAGNIAPAVERLPELGAGTELIFVDGASRDGTRDRIREVIRSYAGDMDIKLVEQDPDLGKGDAVRKGFAAATGDIHVILDADLTVPPEDLPKVVRILATRRARFVNGSRLVYPLENESMRALNKVGNKLFSYAFSWLLGRPVRDTLCGTKAWLSEDWPRLLKAREAFGEFDPFGDFDLLFGAALLDLPTAELPVRYRRRTFGQSKIHTFSHGLLLVRMTWEGFKKLKLRRPPRPE